MSVINESVTEASQSWWSADYKIGALHSLHTGEYDVACMPHRHAEYAFIACLAGRLEFIREGKHYALEAGDMLVHNAGQLHQSLYGTDGLASETASLIVNESIVRNLLLRMRPTSPLQAERFMFQKKIHNPGVAQLVRDLVGELEKLDVGYEVIVQSLVLQILVHLFRNCLEPTTVEPGRSLPRQLPAWESITAMRYMGGRREKDFCLSDLCTMIGTSPSRFIPLFRNSTNFTPHAYFNKILMRRAQKLLESGRSSVKEVAYELGFQTPSHFGRVFHTLVGTTPYHFQLQQGKKANSDADDLSETP